MKMCLLISAVTPLLYCMETEFTRPSKMVRISELDAVEAVISYMNKKNMEAVKRLVGPVINPDTVSQDQQTILHAAIENEDMDMVCFAASRTKNPKATLLHKDKSGDSPLAVAIKKKNPFLVKKLVTLENENCLSSLNDKQNGLYKNHVDLVLWCMQEDHSWRPIYAELLKHHHIQQALDTLSPHAQTIHKLYLESRKKY